MPDFQPLLDSLNPQQREAVVTTDGPVLVIAGAGSGKTRVITYRIAYLMRRCGVAPWEIFAATFTNKAAEEMRHRIGKLVPAADTARLAISTFHSLCVGILRREAQHIGLDSRFTICDDTDQMALIKDCLKSLEVPAGHIKPEQMQSWIATAKVLMMDPETAGREMGAEYGSIAGKVYQLYQDRLLANNAVDFDDLILHVVRIFQNHPEVLEKYQDRWRYLLVDEYQDTNRVQFEFIRLLASKFGNLCVVGDEDQSIYSWRGAEIENLLKFPELFAGTRIIRLEQNYRSTETVLKAASAVIARNTQRLGKELWSECGEGEPITMISGFSERDEAAQVVDTIQLLHRLFGKRYSDMAIFFRVNALSRSFEDQLRQARIPYRVIGGIKFYDRAEIKDLLSYLRICVNPRDSIALTRIINKPARGIGEKSLAKLFNDSVQKNVSLYDVMKEMVESDKRDGVSKKALGGLRQFVQHMGQWVEMAEDHPSHEILQRIIDDTGYVESMGDGRDLETISRRENVGELFSALEDFQKQSPGATLADFLERVALVNATDEMSEEDSVFLMSLHCAKGLEYDVVFMTGMEEPLFPSARALKEMGHAEEERRLFYVGITRAKQLLFLSRADSRLMYGRPSYNPPSLFLREVPSELMRTIEDARAHWANLAIGKRDKAKRDSAAPMLRESAGGGVTEPGRKGAAGAKGAAAGAGPAQDLGAEEGLFPVGCRVTHKRLGAGEVIGASGQGEKRKVCVRFDAGLELEVLERFGGLEVERHEDLPF